ncbi:jg2993, partial [Pararge aegeria aegeria]
CIQYTVASPPDGSMENIPAGYEPVSLIEALNGPPPARVRPPPAAPAIASPDTDTASQAAEVLNRCNLERSSSTSLGSSGSRKRDRAPAQAPHHPITPEFRMSVLLAREEEAKRAEEKAASPLLYTRNSINAVDKLSKTSLNSEQRSEEFDEESTPIAEEANEAPETEGEPDSDAERRSPLLTPLANGIVKGAGMTGCGTGAELRGSPLAHIDDTDTDEPDHPHLSGGVEGPPRSQGEEGQGSREVEGAPADDSDYFTPEDTATTILTVPKTPSNARSSSNIKISSVIKLRSV